MVSEERSKVGISIFSNSDQILGLVDMLDTIITEDQAHHFGKLHMVLTRSQKYECIYMYDRRRWTPCDGKSS